MVPSSSGLGRCPLKAQTRVQVSLGSPKNTVRLGKSLEADYFLLLTEIVSQKRSRERLALLYQPERYIVLEATESVCAARVAWQKLETPSI